jgi:excisionase family DNA binding protein
VPDGIDLNPGTYGGSPLMTTAQVAARFVRCPRTVRNWVRAGHLRLVRVGGAVFFREDDVERLANFGSIGGSEPDLHLPPQASPRTRSEG